MYYFDMLRFYCDYPDPKIQYDATNFIASLQGLVNREGPMLYINLIENSDEFWLKHLTREGYFLHGEPIIEINSFEEMLDIFQGQVDGVVLWDEKVPATSNVAATICGVEGYIPVRFDETPHSIYTRVVLNGPRFTVRKNLVGMFTGKGMLPDSRRESSGSPKCDAYLWAKEQYLDKGLCNPTLMAYMVDAYTWEEGTITYGDMDNTLLTNHDYFIARKAFFFDLNPWDDETPNDDKDQPLGTDLATMKEILLSQYRQNQGKRITSIGGFTPWHVKYTDYNNSHCKHGGVDTEWRYAEIVSAYNAVMDADAPMLCGMANASIFSMFPMKQQYRQNPKPSRRKLENKTYILYYMGDFDSAAWLSRMIPTLWSDPRRGEIPLMWPFNPNLSDRAPHVFDYVYKTKSANDYFVAGDSGAGYLNPTFLLEPRVHSNLPSGMDIWVKHNKHYFNKLDLSVTGFIINGYKPINKEVQQAYTIFSPDGVGYNKIGKEAAPLVDGTVFQPHTADIGLLSQDMEEAAEIIYNHTAPKGLQFHIFRMVLCTPSFAVALTEKIQREHPEHNYEVVDPYTFFDLLKQSYEK